MSRERRPGLGGIAGRATGGSTGGLGAPGKRTRTQGLVQRKARAAWTSDPPAVYEENRATIDLGGARGEGEAASAAVGHGDERAGRAAATIDAPAAWDESLGRPTIAISNGVAGEGDGAGAGEVAAGGSAAEPGWVQRARAYHEAHAVEVAAFDQLTGGACAGDDGALDPRKVARWQAEHGVAPDGRVGDATLDAARAAGRAAATPGGGGDRSAVSEPASIDAPARYDEVDRGTLEVGGAVQRRATQTGAVEGAGDPVAVAAAGVEGAAAPLPHLEAIQASFGPHDVTGVRVQVGGAASEASAALGAEAYATGDRVGFAASPSLHTAAHEAAHVVQQRAGVSLKGGVGQAGDAYEQHADAVADAVVRGESAEALLGPSEGGTGTGHGGGDHMGIDARAQGLGAEVQHPPTSGFAMVQRKKTTAAKKADPSDTLVDNLLAAIDSSSRTGLENLEAGADLDDVRGVAQRIRDLIVHLLSVTAVPGDDASYADQKANAAIAFGRAAALEAALRDRDAATSKIIRDALERVEVELVPETGWSWKPEARGRKAGGGFSRAEGIEIGRGTLAIIRRRAQAVRGAQEAGPILVSAAAITEDLQHAHREISLAKRDDQLESVRDEVAEMGTDLARLETLAYQLGVGLDPALEALRVAETDLRQLLGIGSDRVVWESAVPALQAIIDIVTVAVEVKDGVGFDRSKPGVHYDKVPARYRLLLDEWFQITHGRVERSGGFTSVTRGPQLVAHIDAAVASTQPLIDAVRAEGDPGTVAPWLEQLSGKIAEFRARASSEWVHDHIEEKSDKALDEGEAPVDRLDTDTQIKVSAARLVTVSRQTVSIAQRLVTAERDVVRTAMEEFQKGLGDADLPPELKTRLAGAKSLADVATHIAALANAVEAIVNVTDPEARERLFIDEFGRTNLVGGVAEVAKNLLWLVQGGIAAYKLAAAGLLFAKGQREAASALLAESAGATAGLRGLSFALNSLNVVHGLVLVLFGTGDDRVAGAVEATWGGLGLVGQAGSWGARLSRFTGPLGAAIMISHFTLSQIGNAAVAAVYGIVQGGLGMAYEDMQRSAQEIHATSMRLAVALESGDELAPHGLAGELTRQTDALRWNLRDSGLRSYIERTKQRGTSADPGTYKPLRERFKPLWDAPLETDTDIFTTTEIFLAIVVACFDDAQEILERSVEAVVARER